MKTDLEWFLQCRVIQGLHGGIKYLNVCKQINKATKWTETLGAKCTVWQPEPSNSWTCLTFSLHNTLFILRWLVLVFCSIGCTADTVFLKGATAFRSAGEMDPCALAFWSALCKDAKGPSRLTKCQRALRVRLSWYKALWNFLKVYCNLRYLTKSYHKRQFCFHLKFDV